MRFQYVVSEIRTGLRRNLTMTIAVLITVAISMAMFGTGLLISEQAAKTKGYWQDKVEVAVFMCNSYVVGGQCNGKDVSDKQREAIKSTLDELPEVRDVFFENKEEAYKHFKDQYQEDFAEVLTADQMQESYRVALKDPDRYEGVVSAVEGLPGVHNAQDQREVFEPLFRVLNAFQWGALGVAILQIVAAVLLIANTIRLAAYNRRRETGIMRLVGASNFYIQLPFILEAAIAGLIGSILGVVTVWALAEFVVTRRVAPNFVWTKWVGTGDVLAITPWLLLLGMGIAAFASFITLRRYLRV